MLCFGPVSQFEFRQMWSTSVRKRYARAEARQRQLLQQQTGEVFMEWLAENWFSVLIGIVFVGMHMFGHGGHGGHGGRGHGGNSAPDKTENDPDRGSGHRH